MVKSSAPRNETGPDNNRENAADPGREALLKLSKMVLTSAMQQDAHLTYIARKRAPVVEAARRSEERLALSVDPNNPDNPYRKQVMPA